MVSNGRKKDISPPLSRFSAQGRAEDRTNQASVRYTFETRWSFRCDYVVDLISENYKVTEKFQILHERCERGRKSSRLFQTFFRSALLFLLSPLFHEASAKAFNSFQRFYNAVYTRSNTATTTRYMVRTNVHM